MDLPRSPASNWRDTARSFGRILLYRGTITRLTTDAIVNAANPSLLGGGGVDGAIHRAGGPEILEECRYLRARLYPLGLPTGKAVATTAGALPAKVIIHTAGPVWHGGHQHEAEELAACYQSCLSIASGRGLQSIAFPGISTGIYGYPKQAAAAIAVRTVQEFLSRHELPLEVVFVLLDEVSFLHYAQALH